jgi:hypothetical protein
MSSMNAVTPHWPGEKSMSVIDRPSSVEGHSCQWDWYASAIRCDKKFTSTPVAKVAVLQQLLARVKSSPSSNTWCCVYFLVGMADTRNPRLYRAHTWTGSIRPSVDSTRRATRLDLAWLLHACKTPYRHRCGALGASHPQSKYEFRLTLISNREAGGAVVEPPA